MFNKTLTLELSQKFTDMLMKSDSFQMLSPIPPLAIGCQVLHTYIYFTTLQLPALVLVAAETTHRQKYE
jgi:hypothetical protein